MKKKITTSLGITALLIVCIALAFSDSHQTNIRYLMWKWGWTDYSPEISMRYMTVDAPFRNSLKGKDRQEIAKWFPDLRVETKPEQYLECVVTRFATKGQGTGYELRQETMPRFLRTGLQYPAIASGVKMHFPPSGGACRCPCRIPVDLCGFCAAG